jgi:hypothetical protein
VARTFWMESGELWVADGARVTWHGEPDGKPVHSVVALPGTDDAVVVLDFEAGPRSGSGSIRGWPNLVRVRADGSVVWRASALDAQDSWVSVQWSSGTLTANTWSCFVVTLDPETGAKMSQVFSK